jgi:hypothetical protein
MNGIDDGNHASEHSKTFKTRKSMDRELHDHQCETDLDTGPLTNDANDDSSSSSVPVPEDDDSFGEASDSSVPDQKYLDQILEDYHPERLNLLDSRIPEPLSPNRPKTVASPPSKPMSTCKTEAAPPKLPLADKTTDETSPEKETETPDNAEKKEEKAMTPLDNVNGAAPADDVKKAEPAEENSEEAEAADSFVTSPARPKPGLNEMWAQMGSSTKKSFRKVSGTFWSKPFKGLKKSIRKPPT